MLTKRQLEDAINCWFGNCEECSCNGLQKEHGAFDCMVQIIETALTYRELAEKRKAMLKKACILLNDHFCGDEHYSSVGEMAEVEKVLEEAQALLKESEVEHDA